MCDQGLNVSPNDFTPCVLALVPGGCWNIPISLRDKMPFSVMIIMVLWEAAWT